MSIKINNTVFKLQSATKQILLKSINSVHVLAPASYATSLQTASKLDAETAARISGDNSLYGLVSDMSSSLYGVSVASSSALHAQIANLTTATTASVTALSASIISNYNALVSASGSLDAAVYNTSCYLFGLIGSVSGAMVSADSSLLATVANVTGKLETDIYNYDLSTQQFILNHTVTVSGDQTIHGLKTFDDDVTVTGNLIVNGTTISTSATEIVTQNNFITLCDNSTKPLAQGWAGISVHRGTDPADTYYFAFEEARQGFAVGTSGSWQLVATRENTPNNLAVQYWDANAYSLKSSNVIVTGGNIFLNTVNASGSVLLTHHTADLINGIVITNTETGDYVTAGLAGSAGYGVAGWARSTVIESVGNSENTGNLYLGSYKGEIRLYVGQRSINAVTIDRLGNATFSKIVYAGDPSAVIGSENGLVVGGDIEIAKDGVNGSQRHGRIRSVPGSSYSGGLAFDRYYYNGSTWGFSEVLRLGSDGAATFIGSVFLGTLTVPSFRQRNFGYGSGYSATVIGSESSSSNNSNICLGVDPAAIAGGSFGGYGGELFLRRNVILMQPNSGGTDWEKANITLGAATFGGSVGIGVTPGAPNSGEVLIGGGYVLANKAIFAGGGFRATGPVAGADAGNVVLDWDTGGAAARLITYGTTSSSFAPLLFLQVRGDGGVVQYPAMVDGNGVFSTAGAATFGGVISTSQLLQVRGYNQPISTTTFVNVGGNSYTDLVSVDTNNIYEITIGNATDGYMAKATIGNVAGSGAIILSNVNSSANLTISLNGNYIRINNGISSTRTIIYCLTKLYAGTW